MSAGKAKRRPKAQRSARTASTLPIVLQDALQRYEKRGGRKPDGTQQQRLATFRMRAAVIADKAFSAAFNEMFALSMDLAAPAHSGTFINQFHSALRAELRRHGPVVAEDAERLWKAMLAVFPVVAQDRLVESPGGCAHLVREHAEALLAEWKHAQK